MANPLTNDQEARLQELGAKDPDSLTKDEEIEMNILLGVDPVTAAEMAEIGRGESAGDVVME